jgi:hypothetical protein
MPKDNFFTGQPVFTQLLNLIPRQLIGRLSKKHAADRYCKTFMAYDHLVTMLYQGFFQCLSLRELITGLQANHNKLLHLGLTHTPRRSTLSDANSRRPVDFFQSVYHQLYEHLFSHLPDSRPSFRKLFIIDSSTIPLFSNIMQGAGTAKRNGKKKGGVKAHVMIDAEHDLPCFSVLTEARHHDLVFLQQLNVPPGSMVIFDRAYTNFKQFQIWGKQRTIWITRQKNDANFKVERCRPVTDKAIKAGILSDEFVILGRPSNRNKIPLIKARRIVFKDPLSAKELVFITNDRKSSPQHIAELYKKRWQIELLFKRIKQRYPLRYFLGDNPNAVQIQVWCMLLCDMLVQAVLLSVNRIAKRKWSYANLAAMIKHHLMTYIKLIPFLLEPEKALIGYKPPDPFQPKLF